MRVLENTQEVTIPVTKSELIEGKWYANVAVVKKLQDITKRENAYQYRYKDRFHNSKAGNKYNMEFKGGVECINALEPMAKDSASLVLKFEVQ